MSVVAWILYVAFFAAIVLLVLSLALAYRWRRADAAGTLLSTIAVGAGAALMALRWTQSGHPPLFGTFENTLLAAWSLLAFALVCANTSAGRKMWRYAAPWALVLLTWGIRYPKEPVPLTISELSLWVDIHVVFAWSAFVPLLLLGSRSLVSLVRREPVDTSAEDDRAFLQRLLLWGFFAFTGMLVTGAWYLNILFGTLWQWGVVETLSLIVWLAYGVILHGVLWRRWHGLGLRWALLLMVPLLLLAFFIWSVFPGTFHYFDIPLVRPY